MPTRDILLPVLPLAHFPDKNQLNELLHLVSQVTHVHLAGGIHNEPITSCWKSLQYLSVTTWMLSEHMFGTEPFPRLTHVSLFEYADIHNPLIHTSFIRDHFPMITSLHLSVPWVIRNHAMVMAQSQHNVQTLKLIINIQDGIGDEEMIPSFPLEVTNDQLAMLPAELPILQLEVVQSDDELEQGAWYSQWIFNDVVPPATGLGGTCLKSIDLLVSQPKSTSAERERVLSRQWVKAPNGDWQRVE